MRLPSSNRVEISPEKVRNYLLSNVHPVGKFKAQFFRKLGYTSNGWEHLADQLRRIAQTGEAQELPSPFGRKFSIVAKLTRPNERSAAVISIWFQERESSIPRFVTAYPAE